MSDSELLPGTLVELAHRGELVRDARILQVSDDEISLVLPPDSPDLTAWGAEEISVRWAAEWRGRYVLPGRVTESDSVTARIAVHGEVGVEQRRRFVRAGGGERILFRLPDEEWITGFVKDLSEVSVAAWLDPGEAKVGDRVQVSVSLDDVTQLINGTLMRIQPRSEERTKPEIVVIFDEDEAIHKVVRRYVLRQQVLNRPPPND